MIGLLLSEALDRLCVRLNMYLGYIIPIHEISYLKQLQRVARPTPPSQITATTVVCGVDYHLCLKRPVHDVFSSVDNEVRGQLRYGEES